MTVPPIIGRNYLKPKENEKVPILVLDFKKMYACWLPGLKKTLYFNDKPETEELKRIREIVLLEVYVSGEFKHLIELTLEDFKQFESVYDLFSTYGGEILYHRQKEGNKKRSCFTFKPKGKGIISTFRRYSFDNAASKK
jgi:hypothetical protein